MQKEFGYARVSTARQHEDRQVQALLEYGIDERNIVVDKQSGRDFNRAGYQTLRNQLLRSGDTLVVQTLDRFGRDKAKIKEELAQLKADGVRVKVLNIPTTLQDFGENWVLDLVNTILLEVLASLAEQERATTLQRQKEGIAAAKSKGVVFGRPVIKKPDNYEEVMALVDSGQMKAVDAAQMLGLKKTSFYKLRKEYCAERC